MITEMMSGGGGYCGAAVRSRMAFDHASALASGSRLRGAPRWDSRAIRVVRTAANDGACRAVLREAREAVPGRAAGVLFVGVGRAAAAPLSGARKISVTQS